MRLKRFMELIAGVLICLLLLGKYNDISGSRYLIDFIVPYQPFKAIIIIMLIIIASNLIAGKPKDYSNFFYTLLVKLFGDPSKKDKKQQ